MELNPFPIKRNTLYYIGKVSFLFLIFSSPLFTCQLDILLRHMTILPSSRTTMPEKPFRLDQRLETLSISKADWSLVRAESAPDSGSLEDPKAEAPAGSVRPEETPETPAE